MDILVVLLDKITQDIIWNNLCRGESAIDTIIEEYVSREIEAIKSSDYVVKKNEQTMSRMYHDSDEFARTDLPKDCFYANEFDNVNLPKEKKNIIQRAMQWIKERRMMYQNKNDNETEKQFAKEEDKSR